MKKLAIIAVTFATVLLCGCSPSADNQNQKAGQSALSETGNQIVANSSDATQNQATIDNPSAPSDQPETATSSPDHDSNKCNVFNGFPDLSCTPGATDPRVTQDTIKSTICVSGYTATVRPSTSITNKIKTERMSAYGDTDSPSNYELDHLIPLELGGSPDSVQNLWPEPYSTEWGARTKDKVENYFHSEVCNGLISLAESQKEIVSNWEDVYKSHFGNPTGNQSSSAGGSTSQSVKSSSSSATNQGEPAVKKSTTGICHAKGSTYYDRTTNYTAYASLDACLASGGRLPKR